MPASVTRCTSNTLASGSGPVCARTTCWASDREDEEPRGGGEQDGTHQHPERSRVSVTWL